VSVNYSVDEAELVIEDGQGTRWRGRPDGYLVDRVQPIPGGEDAIVLLKYMGAPQRFPNVLRVDRDGEIKWRAKPPGIADVPSGMARFLDDVNDAWVAVRWEKRRGLTANSWSCFYCTLDPGTGAITSAEFTK
jgi:hypothetical protein